MQYNVEILEDSLLSKDDKRSIDLNDNFSYLWSLSIGVLS